MIHKKFIYICAIIAVFSLSKGDMLYPGEYDLQGRIESVRKGDLVTILFSRKPAKEKYYIVEQKTVVGAIRILSIQHLAVHRYRSIARFYLRNKQYAGHIRAGAEIALSRIVKIDKKKYIDRPYQKEFSYKEKITSAIDKRIMIHIPAGKFVLGSNKGDPDEQPEQVLYSKDFYIDKYEVTNHEYREFVVSANAKPPLSWNGTIYKPRHDDLPVMVTWHEAAAYAAWAGKRLPTESEWEKAAGARKTGKKRKKTQVLYPWGSSFSPKQVNSIEFWPEKKTKKGIQTQKREKYLIVLSAQSLPRSIDRAFLKKLLTGTGIGNKRKTALIRKIVRMSRSLSRKKGLQKAAGYGEYIEIWLSGDIGEKLKERLNNEKRSPYLAVFGKGLLPYYFFEKSGASFRSVVNMSGNAGEWTSSWYKPFENNRVPNGKYGTQYKVIRGGAWFSSRYEIRVTSREIGGVPNLYTDNIAGFRCAKDAAHPDRKSK
ncbi:MAG: formylglycine-generating enzyme family protein [bacterium]|nr:formylglycine-generating enzyme family protein [bacterium]